MNNPALQLTNIEKTFVSGPETLQVLKNISLIIEPGEMVSIMGPSGAGKTTLLNIAGGLMRPSTGVVEIGGQPLAYQNDESLSRSRNHYVGFVFQLHHLLPEFSAEENVALPAMISGVKRYEAIQKARKLLAEVGLSERLRHRPGELSGGEQQRVAIARALINQPKLLLADEPTGDLDENTAREIHSLFMRLNREQGQTIIMVTHNPELGKLARRMILLKDGRIVQDKEVESRDVPTVS